MVIELYDFLPSPPCRAVKMTAHILGVELRCIPIDYMTKEHLLDEYRKKNPFHTLPVINDNGTILYESRAITAYFVNKYNPNSTLYPKDPVKRAMVDQMLHLDNGTIFPTGDLILLPQILEGKEPLPESYSKAKELLGNLDLILESRSYVAGEQLTLADLSVSTSLSLFEMGLYDITAFGNVTNYLTLVRRELSPMFATINDEPVKNIKEAVTEIMKKK